MPKPIELSNDEIALITDSLMIRLESVNSELNRLKWNDSYEKELKQRWNEIYILRRRLRSFLELMPDEHE